MVNPYKKEVVKNLKEKFDSTDNLVLVDYRGINVPDVTDLRKKLRNVDCEMKVVKNTLSKLAIKETDKEKITEFFQGVTAVVFEKEDPVEPAKILSDFMKDNEALSIKIALLNNEVIDKDKFDKLAALPSREELLSKLVYLMSYPMTGLVNVLSGNVRNLLNVLNAIKEKK